MGNHSEADGALIQRCCAVGTITRCTHDCRRFSRNTTGTSVRSDELVAGWQEQAHEIAGCLSNPLRVNGARDRNRTGMASRPADFKSDASTNFATRANGWHCPTARIVDRNENARKRGRLAIRLSQSILRRWRPGSELNRRTRLCRPLHNHSATRPVGLCSLTEATAGHRSNETPSTGASCTRNGMGFAPCPTPRQHRPCADRH